MAVIGVGHGLSAMRKARPGLAALCSRCSRAARAASSEAG